MSELGFKQMGSARRHHGWRLGSILLTATCMTVLLVTVASATHGDPSAVTWPSLQLRLVAEGFSRPIAVTSANDGSNRLFVVEQGGVIHILENGELLTPPFLDISDRVSTCGECGLLGLAFPPNFAEEGYFFVNYTSNKELARPDTGDPNTSNDTVIARFHVSGDPNLADADSEAYILTINQPASNHNGGNIVFGPDGYLYIGMGDGGSGGDFFDNGQTPASLLGKMLRIAPSGTATYTVPATNPFTTTEGYRDEIWATGLRNPWRFSFDRATGDLYIADVGQGDYEEIHYVPAAEMAQGGHNFGWSIMEGDVCYPPAGPQDCDRTGLTPPIVTYDHSAGDCSVTGGFVYHSPRPNQAPIYLYADYCTGRFWGIQLEGTHWVRKPLDDFPFRVSSFGEDEDGDVYLVSHDGEIYRIFEPLAYLPTLSKND